MENIVRAVGIFEGLTAMAIFFGDRLGGILFLLHLTVYTAAVHGNVLKKGLELHNLNEVSVL